MEIHHLLTHIRTTPSDRRVHRDTGVARPTVKKFRAWAATQGLLEGPLPPMEELQPLLDRTMPTVVPPQNVSGLESHRDVILGWVEKGVEMAAIRLRLKERGKETSYWALRRFVRANTTHEPDATVRVETAPGEEAQVDFGSGGLMPDPVTGKKHKTWVFVMTLSWSRHQYVEFVRDQRVETWLGLHSRAFAWFGGVPRRLKIDNLRAAIVRATVDDPAVQRAYRECAEHHGFLISPCRPRKPEHKGKVESGVHYVKRNFLGGREATTLEQANRDARIWAMETAGRRIHGTTRVQPLVRFEQELPALQALPPAPYDLAVWKQLRLHRDCHVVFAGSYYSAPFRLCAQRVWLRAGLDSVRIFTASHEMVATHLRATQPGQRLTHPDHLPPRKAAGLGLTPEICQERAAQVGPATAAVVAELLGDRVVDRLPTVARLLKLGAKYSHPRLEAACRRALDHGDPRYITVKSILARKMEEALVVPHRPAPPACEFVRQDHDLLGRFQEAGTWN